MPLFAEAASMSLELRIPLSIMTFLQYAIWGAWFVVLGNYLNTLKFSRADIGRIYATMSLGAIISPMFLGTLADRYFSSQHLMGVLHILGAFLLYSMAQVKDARVFYWVTLLYALVYSPTLALSNAVIFATVPATTSFGELRVMGTIGWIAAGLSLRLFIRPGQAVNNSPLLLAAALSLALGIFSFFLHDSPPLAAGTGAEAKAIMGVFLEVEKDKGGSGYKEPPIISIKGGGGSGAVAEVQVEDGKVVKVEMKNPGKGYTSAKDIEVEVSGGGGSGAKLKPSLQVVEAKVEAGGSGYKAKKIPLVIGDGQGAVVESTLGDNGSISEITVIKGGSGYTKEPSLVFPQPGIPFVGAFKLFSETEYAVFFVVSFLITIALAFYYSFAGLYLEQGVGVKSENVGPLMTIGQWVEIPFLFFLGWFVITLGMKNVLLIGMAAWGLRYAIFAIRPPLPLILVGVGLHGICFDFFFAAGMMHTENIAPVGLKASAQSLFAVLTYGLGMWLGTEAAGWLNQRFTKETTDPVTGQTSRLSDWRSFWLIPAVGVVVCLVLFVVLT
jgi:MFS family permease